MTTPSQTHEDYEVYNADEREGFDDTDFMTVYEAAMVAEGRIPLPDGTWVYPNSPVALAYESGEYVYLNGEITPL